MLEINGKFINHHSLQVSVQNNGLLGMKRHNTEEETYKNKIPRRKRSKLQRAEEQEYIEESLDLGLWAEYCKNIADYEETDEREDD